MNCLAVSDSEFAEQLKLLNRQQLEDLGSVFQKRYEILRQAYQEALKSPPRAPASVNMVVAAPNVSNTQVQNQNIPIEEPQIQQNSYNQTYQNSQNSQNSTSLTLPQDQIIIPQSPTRGRRSPRRRIQRTMS